MDFQNELNLNFLVTQHDKGNGLGDFADIAQVIIAAVNIGLIIYIYISDKNHKQRETVAENQKSSNLIKLQGFKDFVVAPNFVHLQLFFSNLLLLNARFTTDIISEESNLEINSYIKSEVSKFRINFNDSILNINRPLFDFIKAKIESLSDELITTISDSNIDLSNSDNFERYIAAQIRYTKNEIVSALVNYSGE